MYFCRNKKTLNLLLFTLIATAIFTFSFWNNKISVFSSNSWFNSHQIDSDDIVYKATALVKLQKSNLFSPLEMSSRNTLFGFNTPKAKYKAWLAPSPTPEGAYTSSFGLQKAFIYPIYLLWDLLKNYPQAKSCYVSATTSARFVVILNAIAFAMISLWVAREFSIKSGTIFVGLTCLLSSWVVVFAHSVYWMMWSWYLPLIISLFYFQMTQRLSTTFLVAVMLSMLLKSLLGYEYISTIALSAATPAIYYGIIRKSGFRQICKHVITIGTACVLGTLLAFFIHAIQLSNYLDTSILDGLKHIYTTASYRTNANLGYISTNSLINKSLTASVHQVIFKYITSSSCFEYLWLLFAVVLFKKTNDSVNKLSSDERVLELNALFCTILFALLAPLSWYAIGKGHSFIHTSVNYVLWWVPINLFILIAASAFISHHLSLSFTRSNGSLRLEFHWTDS